MSNIAIALARLCELFNEGLHCGSAKPGFRKIQALLYWVWGIAMLSVFEFHDAPYWRMKWAAFFNKQGISSRTYGRIRVEWQAISYIKLSLDHGKAYAGMSSAGIVEREATRKRKFCQRGCVNKEPALKWWKMTSSFYKFCPIVWVCCDSKRDAHIEEIRVIDMRKTELNSPYVWKYLPKTVAQHVRVQGRTAAYQQGAKVENARAMVGIHASKVA